MTNDAQCRHPNPGLGGIADIAARIERLAIYHPAPRASALPRQRTAQRAVSYLIEPIQYKNCR